MEDVVLKYIFYSYLYLIIKYNSKHSPHLDNAFSRSLLNANYAHIISLDQNSSLALSLILCHYCLPSFQLSRYSLLTLLSLYSLYICTNPSTSSKPQWCPSLFLLPCHSPAFQLLALFPLCLPWPVPIPHSSHPAVSGAPPLSWNLFLLCCAISSSCTRMICFSFSSRSPLSAILLAIPTSFLMHSCPH